ncbi:MAG: isopentenyl phosphate kinase [Candidatus Hodarchaeales archaeon]|jgi:isopentenyl phosphate kinase
MTPQSRPIILVKLGGSILTKDSQFQVIRTDLLNTLIMTLGQLTHDFQFLIVHGAGSFGHYHANAFQLSKGYQHYRQLHGVYQTHSSMLQLNQFLMDSANNFGLFPLSFPPISLCTTENGRISSFAINPIKLALKQGFTPILFGDVVLDLQQGFAILSGDQITPYLAKHLDLNQIIMLTDVEGVYDDNPNLNPNAQFLKEVNLNNTELLRKISARAASGKTRVTGEMEKKLIELQPAVEKGVSTWIMSGLEPTNLIKHLKNKESVGTEIISK